ncbi:MAG: hypothetical protein IKV85_02020 [Ruminococcus sp.]|nr:hypothetical protein [Ruminococcus sp.]
MKELIRNYKISCDMAKDRIGELLLQRNTLRRKNDENTIKELNLNRRIQLLYTEYTDMKEIIDTLEKHERAVYKGLSEKKNKSNQDMREIFRGYGN